MKPKTSKKSNHNLSFLQFFKAVVSLQKSYIFQWLKMFKISLSAGRKAELQLAAIYLKHKAFLKISDSQIISYPSD